MEYPKLKNPPASRQVIQTFGGYDRSTRIADGSFRDMENLTSDHFPALSPRSPRQLHKKSRAPVGLAWKNALCYLEADETTEQNPDPVWGHVRIGEASVDIPLSNHRECQIVSMGAYYIVLSKNLWVNTAGYNPATKEFTWEGFLGGISNKSASDDVRLTPCRIDGTPYDDLPTDRPEAPEMGQMWQDGDTLRQWDGSQWVGVATTYVRLDAQRIHNGFSQYDGVTLSGLTGDLAHLNGSNILWQVGENFVVIQGLLSKPATAEAVRISRPLPLMDFVIECGNRLWGCRYGKNANGEVVNEIYCSKLGDFRNWRCYMGISTDSATISLGSDGPFTGAVSYMGHPIFFKENVLHKVYISANGSHSVVDTPCPGVQSGCAKSLAVVGDTLFYKSRSGIMAYDGSLPVRLPDVFGQQRYDAAVAGAHRDKYYISMGKGDSWDLFVFDTRRKLWHREDSLQVGEFVSDGDRLYGTVGNDILILAGADTPDEGPVTWFAETGPMELTTPDRKYLTRLNVRLSLEPGTEVFLYVRYDFSPRWEHLHTIIGKDLSCLDIPLRPKRCDHMYLRLEGKGTGFLYSITKTVEQGSERL